jgi:exosortase K
MRLQDKEKEIIVRGSNGDPQLRAAPAQICEYLRNLRLMYYRKRVMNQRPLIRIAQLVAVLGGAVGLKFYYSTATVNQLRWILAPTTFLVELVTGSRFEFESHAGYMKSDHTFLIAASCAGVNFLITSFLMLSLRKLWKDRSRADGRRMRQTLLDWSFLPMAAVFAYLATLFANTIRIATALLHHGSTEIGWFDRDQLHRAEGIVIYFGVLLALFMFTEAISYRTTGDRLLNSATSRRIWRPYCFPLLVYYATTLGVPILNGAYHRADFWEHLSFVLVTPLILILPLLTFSMSKRQLPRMEPQISQINTDQNY